ncbi:MAG: glycosyltransferase family 2 protein [Nitrospiraceae bacterium]
MNNPPTAPPDVDAYWVVIPAYNEAATIRDVVSRTLQHMTYVVVVDDGSTDETAATLAGLPITLLRNEVNDGKASALWRGFQHALNAGACGVVTLDGDGQHAPEDIVRLVAVAMVSAHDLIIGVRRRDRRRAAVWRYGANCIADFWISWASGAVFEDSQSGFRLYPASLLKNVTVQHGRSRSFVFESEILIEASHAGYRSVAVAIDALRRPGARPSYFRPVLDIARITLMVAGKLLSRGMYPEGLYRTLVGERMRMKKEEGTDPAEPARRGAPLL